MRALSPAPTGRNMTAQGNALGHTSPKAFQALKGRHNLANLAGWFAATFCSAPSGRRNYLCIEPRALPWAWSLAQLVA